MLTTPQFDNPLQREQIQRIANDWRLTPATFAQKISRGSWIPKKHLQYISARIAIGIAKGNARIIISAPPRHGKSQLASIYTPAWCLERFPGKNIIMSTYGADLSIGFGRQVRDILMDPQNKDLLTTNIRQDSKRVAAFLTDKGGGMYSVGLGGPITGRGADILMIDDYIKEIKEALSPSYRDYCWNWFSTTAYTRLEPGGSCIIIATRWHSDDLIGRILTNFPGQWEYINLPAEAKENDIIGREVGEPLFPERYPLTRLAELKETLGSIFYGALFQQDPVDETKKMTNGEWLKVVDILPKAQNSKVGRIWDMAATEGGGDYTVGTKEHYYPNTGNLYIENVVRRQLSSGKVEELIRNVAVADGLDCTVYIEQEPGASGKALFEHFKNTVLPEFRVVPVPAVTNKVVRAQPFVAAAESGKVHLLAGAWNQVFIREFDTFPGAFDDQVDTAAAGYSAMSGKKQYTASWGRSVGLGGGRSTTANATAIKRAMFTTASGGRARGATFGR